MSIGYFCITVFSFTGLWALWTYGYRPYILDRFRFAIEGLILELEELVGAGLLHADHPGYRFRRALLGGLIEVAPHFGFLQLVEAHAYNKECLADNEPVGRDFEETLGGLQPYVQNQLRRIDNATARRTMRFVRLRSPFLSVAGLIAKAFGVRKRGATEPEKVFQHEAYVSGMEHMRERIPV